MNVERIHYTSDFRKSYRRLPKNLQDMADRKDALFRTNPFHPSLETHRLHGKLAGLWSFSITKQYRVLFEFIEGGAIFYDVGTHEIYR